MNGSVVAVLVLTAVFLAAVFYLLVGGFDAQIGGGL